MSPTTPLTGVDESVVAVASVDRAVSEAAARLPLVSLDRVASAVGVVVGAPGGEVVSDVGSPGVDGGVALEGVSLGADELDGGMGVGALEGEDGSVDGVTGWANTGTAAARASAALAIKRRFIGGTPSVRPPPTPPERRGLGVVHRAASDFIVQ